MLFIVLTFRYYKVLFWRGVFPNPFTSSFITSLPRPGFSTLYILLPPYPSRSPSLQSPRPRIITGLRFPHVPVRPSQFSSFLLFSRLFLLPTPLVPLSPFLFLLRHLPPYKSIYSLLSSPHLPTSISSAYKPRKTRVLEFPPCSEYMSGLVWDLKSAPRTRQTSTLASEPPVPTKSIN